MLLDLIYPKWCLNCGKIGTYLCSTCREKLEYVITDGCLYCDKISKHGLTHGTCKRKHGIDGIQSFLYYSNEMKHVMKELKYNQVRDAYHEIFWSLSPEIVSKVAFFNRYRPFVYILPLPLHNRRLQYRGFNQTEVISKYLSNVSGIPILKALERVKDTPQQVRQASRWQRLLNIRNAFNVPDPAKIAGKTIVLFDDVITSGSTVKEACRCLKKAGATHVFALSLLRD